VTSDRTLKNTNIEATDTESKTIKDAEKKRCQQNAVITGGYEFHRGRVPAVDGYLGINNQTGNV
jgi:hypothetical protein